MWSLQASVLALLASSAAARQCLNFTVPVTASARNGVFGNIAVPQNNQEVTQFVQNFTRQGGNFSAVAATGFATVSGTYNISAMYCQPNNGSSQTLQILTHGIGFDKTYWDLSYHNYNYSYIASAVDQYGYSTLSYDRLGIGNSSHGDPLNTIQTPLETAVLAQLTMMLRNQQFPGINSSFSRIVHVGHSFGSVLNFAMTAMYPNISDGIVLTGYSANSTFMPYFLAGGDYVLANLNQPLRFGNASFAQGLNTFLDMFNLQDLVAPVDLTTLSPLNYPNGYLAPSNSAGNQYSFLYPPHYDPEILYYAEASKQPVTVGELLTIGAMISMNSFSGPALVITGAEDVPFCGGNCTATGGMGASIPAAVGKTLPSARNFQAYIQPNSGHGINLHYNSTGAYSVIANYLAANGLGASR